MDNFRFIQILQSLADSLNSSVSNVNSAISEAQTSTFNSVSQSDYEYLQNSVAGLTNQLNYANQQLADQQQNYQRLLEEIQSSSAQASQAEIMALRDLYQTASSERDSLRTQLEARDQEANHIAENLATRESQLEEANKTISNQLRDIEVFNGQMSEVNKASYEKDHQISELKTKISELQKSLEDVKEAVSKELLEAEKDIESAIDKIVDQE